MAICMRCNGAGEISKMGTESQTCASCGGSGQAYGEPGRSCTSCGGRGRVERPKMVSDACPACSGLGRQADDASENYGSGTNALPATAPPGQMVNGVEFSYLVADSEILFAVMNLGRQLASVSVRLDGLELRRGEFRNNADSIKIKLGRGTDLRGHLLSVETTARVMTGSKYSAVSYLLQGGMIAREIVSRALPKRTGAIMFHRALIRFE